MCSGVGFCSDRKCDWDCGLLWINPVNQYGTPQTEDPPDGRSVPTHTGRPQASFIPPGFRPNDSRMLPDTLNDDSERAQLRAERLQTHELFPTSRIDSSAAKPDIWLPVLHSPCPGWFTICSSARHGVLMTTALSGVSQSPDSMHCQCMRSA